MEDSTESDTDSEVSLSDGSGISVHLYSYEEFSSDTDIESEYIRTQSPLCPLDIHWSDIKGEDLYF